MKAFFNEELFVLRLLKIDGQKNYRLRDLRLRLKLWKVLIELRELRDIFNEQIGSNEAISDCDNLAFEVLNSVGFSPWFNWDFGDEIDGIKEREEQA